MESNKFIQTILKGDWSEEYKLSKDFEILSTQNKEKIVDNLIEQLNKKSEKQILPILKFLRGHLYLSNLPEPSVFKLVRKFQSLVNRKSPSIEMLECIAGIFHSSVPKSSRNSASKILLSLSYSTNEQVRSTAVRNLGELNSSYDPENLNSKLFDRLFNLWNDPQENILIKASVLHALQMFTYEKDDEFRYTISEIVITALESKIDEFRKGALWILGGGLFGFKVHHNFTNRVLELLLITLKEDRDIPNSWFLTAFKVTSGALPEWADFRLKEIKEEEIKDREYSERIHQKMREHELEERKNRDQSQYKYQVALSFAGEDRGSAQRLADLLIEKGVNVFYDQYEQADLWGKDLYQHLQSVYRDRAQFCVVFLSQAYAQKVWTRHELKQVQARAFKENEEYILPIKIDDTKIPGINETIGYIDLRSESMENIANLLERKLSS